MRPNQGLCSIQTLDRFNSRTREGCDGYNTPTAPLYTVSIHAPGRGATVSHVQAVCIDVVSIHAPGRGATSGGVARRRVGIVSIHAPGRGATVRQTRLVAIALVSIHAPGRGATRGA